MWGITKHPQHSTNTSTAGSPSSQADQHAPCPTWPSMPTTPSRTCEQLHVCAPVPYGLCLEAPWSACRGGGGVQRATPAQQGSVTVRHPSALGAARRCHNRVEKHSIFLTYCSQRAWVSDQGDVGAPSYQAAAGSLMCMATTRTAVCRPPEKYTQASFIPTVKITICLQAVSSRAQESLCPVSALCMKETQRGCTLRSWKLQDS